MSIFEADLELILADPLIGIDVVWFRDGIDEVPFRAVYGIVDERTLSDHAWLGQPELRFAARDAQPVMDDVMRFDPGDGTGEAMWTVLGTRRVNDGRELSTYLRRDGPV